MISSTRSSESASRSSRNEASGVTSVSSTPSRSAVISCILESISSRSKPSLLPDLATTHPWGAQRVVYPQNALLHSHPAVHSYRLPGDVTGLLGHQEGNDLSDLLRLAEPAGRNLLPYLLLHVLGQAPRQLRLDVTGRHGVYSDPPLRNLARHALGEPDDPGLRGCVVGLPGVTDEPDDGTHVHD